MEVPTDDEPPSKPRPNQHKPLPPRPELDKWVVYYWRLGFSDPKIADHVLDHFDREIYGLSYKSVQRLRAHLELKGTIKQTTTFEDLNEIYSVIRPRFPNMGARRMVSIIRQDYSIRVSERLVNDFLKFIEPEAVQARKRGRFKRRRFWSAGVMEILSIDQHDKWGRFGLWLHIGIDPFSGRIAWLKIWWCNRNPRLLIGYYLEAARAVGGIPLISMSDRGRENNGIANVQTNVRQHLDPTLEGTLQHYFCVKTDNIKSEAGWSQFRRQWAPGFEDVLEFGVLNGLYDPANPLENLVFRWLALPWLQTEIDAWVQLYNSTTRRANRNKILPHGIPDVIHAKPERFNSKNFMIVVPPAMINELEAEFAPRTDPVFQRTPWTFDEQAMNHYKSLGSPNVSRGTFWDIYSQLLDCFQSNAQDMAFDDSFRLANLAAEDEMDLMEGNRELRNGDRIVGDHAFIDNYAGEFSDVGEKDYVDYAEFTDDEEN